MFRTVARCLTLTAATVPLRVARSRQPTAVALICRQYMNHKAKYDGKYYDEVCQHRLYIPTDVIYITTLVP